MWRKAPSPLALRALRGQIASRPFTCNACMRRGAQSLTRPRAPPRAISVDHARVRAFSQPAPVTNVGAQTVIPARLRALHEQLSRFAKEGANYADLSQLKLALRGLEAEDATVRIAILAVSGSRGAWRLARALLADHLEPQADWETALLELEDDSKAILIKYGEHYVLDDGHPLINTLLLPSSLLLRHKLEILVTDLFPGDGNNSTVDGSLQNLLVPMLGSPTSTSGRTPPIAFPVHQAIVVGEGIEGARAIFRSLESRRSLSDLPVLGVLDAAWRTSSDASVSTPVLTIDLTKGETAIASLRKSVKNATEYEHGWLDSNVGSVLPKLLIASASEIRPLKPAIQTLIRNVLDEAQDRATMQLLSTTDEVWSTGSTSTAQSLNTTISSWAESAHQELRDSLAEAFQSRSWRKLAWWKLPWRVDDINLVLGELLQRAYLGHSEKGIIWVSGSLRQAGFLSTSDICRDTEAEHEKFGFAPTNQQLYDMVFENTREYYVPWPTQVDTSRRALLAGIPELQATAQSLLLGALSANALFSAIAALAYVSDTATSLFEAGAVASFGLVLSARYVQKYWEQSRKAWVLSVEEEGRRVLIETEAWARNAVQEGLEARRLVKEDDESKEGSKQRFSESLKQCRALLEET